MKLTFPDVLLLLFLGLKLTHNIDWSWWWVTSPLWIPLALYCAFRAVLIVGALLVGVLAKVWEKIG